MKKTFTILFLAFYLGGTLSLPLGDFSIIRDLPDIYKHCKETEDNDLTVFEFFTEHISVVGQLAECMEHDEADDNDATDKPHAPVQLHCQQPISVIAQQLTSPTIKAIPASKPLPPLYNDGIYITDYTTSILRPPIALV